MAVSLEQLESTVENYKDAIAEAEMAERLAANPDFQALVHEGYLRREVDRLSALYASGRLDAAQLTQVERNLHAVGAFRIFMQTRIAQGYDAKQRLPAAQADLEEARAMLMAHAEDTSDAEAEYLATLGA
jgi:hypothetical protein